MAQIETMPRENMMIKLLGAPDEDIGNPRPSVKTGQALQIELARETVREMQRHMRVGKAGIQLVTGKSPLLRYGNKSMPLRISSSPFRNELYQANNEQQNLHFKAVVSHKIVPKKEQDPIIRSGTALAQLQESMATIAKEKESNKATFLDGVSKPTSRTLKAPTAINGPGGIQPSGNSTTVSPAIRASAVASNTQQPSSSGTVVSPVQNAYKTAILHLLAIRPLDQTLVECATRIPRDQCVELLSRFAVQSTSSDYKAGPPKWTLKDRTFKSLDLWNFEYKTESDRELAIENAVKAYDRQRVPRDDKAWDLLLPVSQRGKGIVLSKLNLNPFSVKPSTPVIRRQPANGHLSDAQSPPHHRTLLSEAGGEPMARTKSLESMAWKKNESENRIKNMINKKPAKPSTPKMTPKTAAKKDGVVAKQAEPKKAASKPATKRKSGLQEQAIEFAEEEESSDLEDLLATVSNSANEKPPGKLGVAKRTKQNKIVPPKRKTENKFKSAEKVDDSDDEFSEVDQPANNNKIQPKPKRPTTDAAISNVNTSSSITNKTVPNIGKPEKGKEAGKLQRDHLNDKRETTLERSSTPAPKNITKKIVAVSKPEVNTVKKSSAINEIKRNTPKTSDTTSSPKITSQIPTTKKKPAPSNFGLGITFGVSDNAEDEDESGTKTVTKQKKKEPATVKSGGANETKSNATSSNIKSTANATLRTNETVRSQHPKQDATTTDSSANSWASCLSAKSTPMYRQSSSQSSVSVQLSEMPKARKRPANASTEPPAKKLKSQPAPAKDSSTQVSSSPLSDPRSVSTPSVRLDHEEISPGLQNSSATEISKTPNIDGDVEAASPRENSSFASIAEGDDERTDAVTTHVALDPAKVELERQMDQLRGMYASYIKLRVEIDKAQPHVPNSKWEQLQVESKAVRALEKIVRPLAVANGYHDWVPGMPGGVEMHPDDFEYCATKLYALQEKYNALHDELSIMEVKPGERVAEAAEMYKEVLQLKQLVFPTPGWLPAL